MAVIEELVFKNARELGTLIRTQEVSPVDVVETYLARIEALNPKLNAFITVTAEHALDRAREAEREIQRGRYRGPLHGIPYAPKDLLATKGILTTNGSKVTADWKPEYESTITERLNRAGAILIGKLNLNEFATGSGVTSGFGPVRNPWHLDYSPGGSSSGSGAALAAYMLPLSIGSDTGGSIRGPAAYSGIVGMRQTYGRVSRYGVTSLSWTLDVAGPMTKTVGDTALMLQAIAGADPKDRSCSSVPVPDYSKALTGEVRGLRIGVPTSYFFDDLHPEIAAGVRAAIEQLREAGARLVDVEVPHAAYAPRMLRIIIGSESSCFHEKRLEEKAELFDPLVRERQERAKFYLATDYIKAMRVRTILMDEVARVFEQCDILAVPTNGRLAPKHQPPEVARTDAKPPGTATRNPGRGNTQIGSMVGMPSIVVPCGFSSEQPTRPITIMFYARPFDEFTLFRVGHAYESATDWHKRRPPI